MKKELINKITDNTIMFLAVMSIPLNIIVNIALKQSEYLLPRFVLPFFSLIIIVFAVLKHKIPFKIKIWTLTTIFFLGAVFTLSLGLLDMASLWFVLTMIYMLFITQKNKVLYVFFSALLLMIITGYFLIFGNKYIPLKYNFDKSCYPCVVTRIIHFIIVGSIVYYIISNFIKEINLNLSILNQRAEDLKKVNESLHNEMKEKKQIQQQLLDTIILTEEKERKRIAADLHDGLGPVLSSVNLYYQAYIDEKNPKVKIQIEKKLKNIIDNAVSEVSRISHNISPNILENNGLVIALEDFINHLSVKKDLSIDLEYDYIKRFDIKKELAVYRALTELINNSLKHAKASLITIRMKISKGFLNIHYSDDGIGFELGKLSLNKGIGLINIKNRLQSLEGFFSFKSAKNQGFQAIIKVPYF